MTLLEMQHGKDNSRRFHGPFSSSSSPTKEREVRTRVDCLAVISSKKELCGCPSCPAHLHANSQDAALGHFDDVRNSGPTLA